MPKEKQFRGRLLLNLLEQHLKDTYYTFNSPVQRFVMKRLDKPESFYCYVCSKCITGSANNIIGHVQGRTHLQKLDELKNSVIMAHISNFQEQIIGLEYLVELAKCPDGKSLYYCSLCRMKYSTLNILNHFVRTKHIEEMLSKHFPEISKKIQKYLGNDIQMKNEFLKLTTIIIAQSSPLFNTMLPTVCFYDEFNFAPDIINGLIESKLHLKETPEIILKVTNELIEVIESLEMPKEVKQEKVELSTIKKEEVFEPKIPKVALSKDGTGTWHIIQKNQETPTDPLHKLTNAEIEFLMAKFEQLDTEKQNNLLKLLLHLKDLEPERYKILKSPFSI